MDCSVQLLGVQLNLALGEYAADAVGGVRESERAEEVWEWGSSVVLDLVRGHMERGDRIRCLLMLGTISWDDVMV